VIRPEHLNLCEIIMENVNIGIAVALGKNINLEYNKPPIDCTLVSDRAMINTVLRNLISNAIKYTPQYGNIIVSLMKKGDVFHISVQDSGMGINEETLKNLFQTNAIQSTPGTANEKGTGLGLILCKDFVNKLGGDIWAESDYGIGSIFTFTLKNL
jgi:signal transduction histidine kinase